MIIPKDCQNCILKGNILIFMLRRALQWVKLLSQVAPANKIGTHLRRASTRDSAYVFSRNQYLKFVRNKVFAMGLATT